MPEIDSPLPASCPVIHDALVIQDLGRNFSKALRRLRRDIAHCNTCSALDTCPLLANLNETIQTAINQVLDEWQSEPIML
jgi:hypothetical protein